MKAAMKASLNVRRRRILLSAFACSPHVGSEPGVAWHWAIELAQRHDIVLLTHAHYQEEIEEALRACPRPGLQFHYFRVPGVGGHPHWQLNSRLYYLAWQFAVRQRVRGLLAQQAFDLIHHLTWGSYRLPGRLGGLGPPLVIGPVGGGEGAPWRLYRRFPWREHLFYAARQASIQWSRFDPFVRLSMRHAQLVLAKTHETHAALPSFVHGRVLLASEIGIAAPAAAPPRPARQTTPLRLLYAGRLLGGKGLPYLLLAMRLLRSKGLPVRLDVAGDGRLMSWAQAQLTQFGLHDSVQLLGMVPRVQMSALYEAADVLVFPSWHDSSGNVVAEALARGLPVLCLDLGGPRYVADEHSAVVVNTHGLDAAGVAHALAREIEALLDQPLRLAALSAGARNRAGQLGWGAQVARAYEQIEQRLGWTAPSDAEASSVVVVETLANAAGAPGSPHACTATP